MRLWSLHPKYLDSRGLVALWREALLARAVLAGATRGYRHHPQLERFRAQRAPLAAIDAYLAAVHREASARGYAFDASKLGPVQRVAAIPVATGQLECEWRHLLGKLARRAPERFEALRGIARPDAHPLFKPRAGPVASWEKAADET